MGCVTSRSLKKQAKAEAWSITGMPTFYRGQMARSFKDYHDHLVDLTSSSYGVLKVDSPKRMEEEQKKSRAEVDSFNDMFEKLRSFEMAVESTPTSWNEVSNMLENIRPGLENSTPSLRKSGSQVAVEAVTISVEDLMDGLEDDSPLGRSPVKLTNSSSRACVPRKPRSFDKSLSFHTIEELEARLGRATSRSTALLVKSDHDFVLTNGIRKQNGYVTEVSIASSNYHQGQIEHSPNNVSFVKTFPKPTIDNFDRENKNSDAAIPATGQMNSSTSGKSSSSKYSSNEKVRLTFDIKSKDIYPSNLFSQQTLSIPDSKVDIISIQAACANPAEIFAEHNCPLFDPDLLASYEKALQDLSEDDWNAVCGDEETGTTVERLSPRQEGTYPETNMKGHSDQETYTEINVDELMQFSFPHGLPSEKRHNALKNFEKRCPPGGDMALVLYTTTLRGIRKTFEDCNNVKSILQSFGLSIDERDVSMHLEFCNELRKLLEKPVSVPRLFIKGRYIGAAEEVLKLHEQGTLAELIEGLPTEVSGDTCDGCGGLRFVPCLECSGSCKVVDEENKFVRCSDCNENGLIQCPICS